MKTLHIFRSGEFKPMEGSTLSFSDDDLKAIADNYDPALSEAPIVIGHPRTDGPAWGWVSSVNHGADGLRAVADQVDADFADAVNKGRYKKISASFFTPTSPNNPTPGAHYLRHVGFLGATAPAVKGLTPPSFADKEINLAEDDEIVTVEFSDGGYFRDTVASLFASIRDHLIERGGADEADKILPSHRIDGLRQADALPAFTDPAAADASVASPDKEKESIMTTKPTDAELAAEREKLEADKKAQDEREAAFAQRRAEADAKTFVAELGGKVLPAEVDGLVSFIAGLRDDDTVSFGGAGDETRKPAKAFLKDFLEGLPDRVDFSERTNGATPIAGAASFAAPEGHGVDRDRLDVHARAEAMRARHPDMAYLDAVKLALAG